MTLRTVNAVEAYDLISRGAALVDIRPADESACVFIPGAVNVPLDRLTHAAVPDAPVIIYHCRSGSSTRTHQATLSAAAICECYVLEGGLEAWRKAGFPIEERFRRPADLLRQVQMLAGALTLLGVVLGVVATPAFFGLSACIGVGLVVAGATGWSGPTRLLTRLIAAMPWNRRPLAA